MTYGGSTFNIPKFGGTAYYVATDGNDANVGTDPTTPFLTIGAALAAVLAGDGISVKGGTYTEVGLDLDTDSVELWLAQGAVIQPASGTCLVISGDNCRLSGNGFFYPAAGEIGIAVPGDHVVIERTVVLGGARGLYVTGDDVRCCDIGAGNQTSIGFDLQAGLARLEKCYTVGSGGASIGFKIGNSADIGVLDRCVSENNGTAGYYIDTGCANWTIKDCSSGGDDGKWVDVDQANTFVHFSFASRLEKVIDIAQGGGGTYSYNLFKITGTVKIISIQGIVQPVLVGSNSAVHIDVFSANGNTALSKTSTLTIAAALLGALLAKLNLADKVLSFVDPAAPQLLEGIDPAAESFRVVEDRTGGAHVATYIRFLHTTSGVSSGGMHWHVEWEPISDDGFLELA